MAAREVACKSSSPGKNDAFARKMRTLEALREIDIFDLNSVVNELALEIEEQERIVDRVEGEEMGGVALFRIGSAYTGQKTRRIRTFW